VAGSGSRRRARRDQLLIRRGLAALGRAESLTSQQSGRPGPYQLQAAIGACHARARVAEDTDWPRIAELYDALSLQAASPVVELNRAVAVAMADGPQAGLKLVDELAAVRSMQEYHLLASVRGDLLVKLDRPGEAQREFERAAALTGNERSARYCWPGRQRAPQAAAEPSSQIRGSW
jgi:predicted RNA polymerase sigma factor